MKMEKKYRDSWEENKFRSWLEQMWASVTRAAGQAAHGTLLKVCEADMRPAMSWAFQARWVGLGRARREEDGRSVRNELMSDVSA